VIDIGQIIPTLVQRVQRLAIGDYLEVTSYKRDRGLLVVRLDPQRLRLIEQGFVEHVLECDEGELARTLRPLIKREFPRSNKLRLYAMGPYDAYLAARVQRKTL